jgi:hypothetical protein
MNTLRWKLLQLASVRLRIILFGLRTAYSSTLCVHDCLIQCGQLLEGDVSSELVAEPCGEERYLVLLGDDRITTWQGHVLVAILINGAMPICRLVSRWGVGQSVCWWAGQTNSMMVDHRWAWLNGTIVGRHREDRRKTPGHAGALECPGAWSTAHSGRVTTLDPWHSRTSEIQSCATCCQRRCPSLCHCPSLDAGHCHANGPREAV